LQVTLTFAEDFAAEVIGHLSCGTSCGSAAVFHAEVPADILFFIFLISS